MFTLLQQVMGMEICLVVRDGWDEWVDLRWKLVQPLNVSNHNQCTVLTTTRSWKLTDERMKDSYIDSIYLLEGVKDSFKLT